MRSKSFTKLQSKLHDLSYVQLKKLKHEVERLISTNEVGKAIAEREEMVAECPHCGAEHFVRYGTTSRGQQRYKCKACCKTFNSLTGTPLDGMKLQDKWHEYSEGMWYTEKTREVASALGINVKTAWRWRHRLLLKPRETKPSELHGIIEADETFINLSEKGCRELDRKARKRGGGDVEKVPVLIALDRHGAVTHKVLNRITKEELASALVPMLTAESVLCTDGNVSYQSIVKSLPFKLDHKRLVASSGERVIETIYHIQTLNNWMMRFKQWLKQFNGVGSIYLDNYLSWFRKMDQAELEDSWVVYAL